jgi:hypothetical protein
MKGRFKNQPFPNQPKPKLNQKPNHLYGNVESLNRFCVSKTPFYEKGLP